MLKTTQRLNPLSSTVIVVMLCFFASPLHAMDIGQLSQTDLKDKWGQLLFCQFIYTMQEVKPRLYEFDTEQCDAGTELVTDLVSKYSPEDKQALKNQAEEHARALALNVSEPYHSVPACREYCGKLSAIQHERTAGDPQ